MKDKILDLRQKGLSYRQIEAELGVSRSLISYYCSPTGKEKNLSRQRRNRRQLSDEVQEIKVALGCKDCGETHPACLDFHHRDALDKSFTIAVGLFKHSRETVLAEIDKCDVLCANCHRKHHWNERLSGVSSEEER